MNHSLYFFTPLDVILGLRYETLLLLSDNKPRRPKQQAKCQGFRFSISLSGKLMVYAWLKLIDTLLLFQKAQMLSSTGVPVHQFRMDGCTITDSGLPMPQLVRVGSPPPSVQGESKKPPPLSPAPGVPSPPRLAPQARKGLQVESAAAAGPREGPPAANMDTMETPKKHSTPVVGSAPKTARKSPPGANPGKHKTGPESHLFISAFMPLTSHIYPQFSHKTQYECSVSVQVLVHKERVTMWDAENSKMEVNSLAAPGKIETAVTFFSFTYLSVYGNASV